MSVSGTDRVRQNQRLTEAREEAEEREAQVLKRKNEQLKRAEQRHQREISKLNDAYRTQLSSLREKQMETLASRESGHQEKTESLRNQYQTQLQKKYEAGASEKSQIRETYESQIAKQKETAELQKDNLKTKQQIELSTRDQKLSEIAERSQDKMREAIQNSSRRLKEAHERESSAVREGREKQIRDSELEKIRTRDNFKGQIDDVKKQSDYKEASWREKYNSLYNQVYDPENESGPTRSQMLQAELQNIENRYGKKYEDRVNQLESSRAAFEDTVSDRVNNQVKSKDTKISSLQTRLNQQEVNNRRLRALEAKNIQGSYENKIQDLEGQRSEIQELMSELNADRIGKMKDQNDTVLRRASLDSRSKSQIEKAKYQEHVAGLELMQQNNLDRVTNQAETRVEKIKRVTDQTTQKLSEYFTDSIDMNRESFDKKIVDQREKNIQLQSQNQRMMSEKFRKLEKSFTSKLDSAIEQYESKLQQMKDTHEKEIRNLKAQEKMRLQDREKGLITEKESVEMKYESKLSMVQDQHQEQLSQIQKRHQEEMRDLAVKMNQYNRKA